MLTTRPFILDIFPRDNPRYTSGCVRSSRKLLQNVRFTSFWWKTFGWLCWNSFDRGLERWFRYQDFGRFIAFVAFFYVFTCSMNNRLYTTIHINEAISLVILRALLKFITYLKEFMVSDWLTAMCWTVMSNDWRHNLRYDFFRPRYDVIMWTKNSYLTLWCHTNGDIINFRRSGNVKQHKCLSQICPTTGNFFNLLNKWYEELTSLSLSLSTSAFGFAW